MPVVRLTNIANCVSLLEEIREFLNNIGWSIEEDLRGPTEGVAAGGAELVVENGGVLAGLRSTDAGNGANRLYLFDGIPPYGSSVDLDSLPGNSGVLLSDAQYTASADAPARVINPAFAGPFPTVTFFSDDPSTYFHCAIEVIAGRFRHLHFGHMLKFGTWTGGAYYAMTRWDQSNNNIDVPNNSAHSSPFDGSSTAQNAAQWTFHYEDGGGVWRAPQEITLNGVVRRRGRGSMRGGFGQMFRSVQETPFSGLIALQPVTVWAATLTDTPNTVRCIGQIPDIADINMRNLQPGESYFIGSDEWIVFPYAQKREPTERLDIENSGYYGIAYRVRS